MLSIPNDFLHEFMAWGPSGASCQCWRRTYEETNTSRRSGPFVIDEPVRLSGDTLTTLVGILSKPSVYLTETATYHRPDPGYFLVFTKEDDEFVVFVDLAGCQVGTFRGEDLTWADCYGMEPEFVQLRSILESIYEKGGE
jgi:hypothetical protein